MKRDLLEKINNLIEEQKESKSDEIKLSLSKRELQYIQVWIKTAYANEDALDEVLGLNK